MKKFIATLCVVCMLFLVCIPCVSAEKYFSPTGETEFKISVQSSNSSEGKIEKSVSDDGEVKLVALSINEKKFNGWSIKGDYEIVSGTLKSKTIIIKPKSDLVIIAHFGKSYPGKKDDGGDSPDTADNAFAGVMVAFAAVAVAASAAFVGKKCLSK